MHTQERSMITNSISHFLSDISSITNLSEKCSKLNAFNRGLQDELKNILAFKYQLPICILLLTQAIKKLNHEEIPGCRKKEISPGNVEWYPAPEDNSGDKDMKNWMSSVTLSLKPEIESGMKKEVENSGEIFNFSNNGRDFLQFKRRDSCTSPNETNFNPNEGRTMSESTNDRSYKKKQRRCWSPELHRLFINALDQLGGAQRATPKYIKDLMHVEDLTNDEIKSHLQKYRMNLRKSPFSAMAIEHNGVETKNMQFPYYSSWNYKC